MNIYVGNIDGQVSESDLHDLFTSFGEVGKVSIVRDRHGISKGFGFVEMPSEDEANSAIERLNRTLFLDRTLDVNESSPSTFRRGHTRSKSRPNRSKR